MKKEKLTAADLALYLGQECMRNEVVPGYYPGPFEIGSDIIWDAERGSEFTPILRPLSDLTSDEENRLVQILDLMPDPEGVPYRDSVIAKIPCLSHAVNYLRSQGFDTDGWIDAGLAIDKTKMEKS